ncbi:dihydrolipoamide acetyltransferase family protein [Nocardioides fonticola]|uniref:Dihydrolipoamide acetyltransferase component of pyruvate dehydrogenase complex n=1 Tax=Nocardioides fonticola TaxID=450363 RepID=A0ABP7XNB0_9ACTN
MPEYKLPDVGEGLTEAEIVTWKVKVGDVVAVNDIVVEIETAKSLVELPSPFAGEVTALLVAEGETVPVGTPIIAIGEPAAAPVPAAAAPAASSAPAAPPAEIDLSNPAAGGLGEGESLVGRSKVEGGAVRRPRRVASGADAARLQTAASFMPGQASPMVEAVEVEPVVEPVVAGSPDRAEPLSPAAVRVLAKPPVRKLAKDLGVDLATLIGSGPGGVITRADVEGAPSPHRAMPERYADLGRPGVAPMQGATETREPIKGVRKAMAQAMVSSAFTAPHVTEWVQVDVTRTVEFVERLRERREFRDLKVSPLLVLARAVTLALRRTPIINSFWDDAAQEVVIRGGVNLGIAAATPRGLVVPNIMGADALSMRELGSAIGDLVAVAREGRTQPADMAGGTFTITNVGVFGVDGGTPIINPGESAILCFGQIADRPWVVDGELAVRKVATLTLSFDHRHIDGEAGSRFLADVASILEDPATGLVF